VSGRAERLIALLPEAGVDAVLVTNIVNVRYLTGFTGSSALAVLGPGTRAFVTDFRYVERAADEVDPSYERRRARTDLIESIAEVLPIDPLRLGFEEGVVTVREHARLREVLPDRVELVAAGALVEQLRAVKEPEELEAIRAAASLADAALEQLLGQGLGGRTERELARTLDSLMLDLGAESPSFETIVAAGPHGALPHATPRDVEVRRGDMVVIDWGARLGGYCSDCTRTVSVGDPDPLAREVYELVLRAQLAALDAVRAGASTREVDATARGVIEAAGHAEHFGHGVGHGVGLDVHEAPRVSPRSDQPLQAGNVVTIEPGVYLPGELGVRIEDLVSVREDGCEILTSIPKQLTATD
jgi:Xaa-Pro aminopeptidase